ncbi:MAG TPA: translesion error-prone DNA polymerase V autoproteolytic subunit [Panacibacter sp.]|nr:translesion error-prone DNA polymerase V autoproteolytic subunit [Panacibacter sp.]HNP46819.1 translesion error-prone DNA polymerase V autoproteolytic subunit [Panacibacter sp.]
MAFPSPAADYMEERISLDQWLIQHPLSTFFFKCEGDSMVNAFIPPKAILVVDRSLTAQNGDIVVAVLNGEFTVRYLRKNDRRCSLVPANNKLKELEITEGMDFMLWGVVISVISNPKDLKHVCFG